MSGCVPSNHICLGQGKLAVHHKTANHFHQCWHLLVSTLINEPWWCHTRGTQTNLFHLHNSYETKQSMLSVKFREKPEKMRQDGRSDSCCDRRLGWALELFWKWQRVMHSTLMSSFYPIEKATHQIEELSASIREIPCSCSWTARHNCSGKSNMMQCLGESRLTNRRCLWMILKLNFHNEAFSVPLLKRHWRGEVALVELSKRPSQGTCLWWENCLLKFVLFLHLSWSRH